MGQREKKLLVVDDDDAFRTVLSLELKRRGFDITSAATGEAALAAFAEAEPAVVLLDLRLPDMDGLEVLDSMRKQSTNAEVIMLTGHGTIDTAIRAIQQGAFDYVAKPCPLDDLEIRISRALERQNLRERNVVLERGLRPVDSGRSVVWRSEAFQAVVNLVDRVAPTDSTVLILGETGVGKGVMSRLVHSRSTRSEGPFVVVECAALQENLLQSELFGHERGAFTGAERTKPGLFEVAEGGTIFLDEIGEVNLATQVKLLRVLDSGTFRRVGGTKDLNADVRIVAATNRDVRGLVRQGLFREDFYYRLSTITLEVPPLRERPEDIDALVEHLLAHFNSRVEGQRRIGAAAMDRIRKYPWPGNVRELVHAIEGAMIVCDEDEIAPAHLPAPVRAQAGATLDLSAGSERTPLVSLDDLERIHIERVLVHTDGHRGEAAAILGISERNLYRKIAAAGDRDPS